MLPESEIPLILNSYSLLPSQWPSGCLTSPCSGMDSTCCIMHSMPFTQFGNALVMNQVSSLTLFQPNIAISLLHCGTLSGPLHKALFYWSSNVSFLFRSLSSCNRSTECKFIHQTFCQHRLCYFQSFAVSTNVNLHPNVFPHFINVITMNCICELFLYI